MEAWYMGFVGRICEMVRRLTLVKLSPVAVAIPCLVVGFGLWAMADIPVRSFDAWIMFRVIVPFMTGVAVGKVVVNIAFIVISIRDRRARNKQSATC